MWNEYFVWNSFFFRVFRRMDDDHNRTLNQEEFFKGIKESGLKLSDEEAKEVFRRFDKDNSGGINFDEFLRGIRVIGFWGSLGICSGSFKSLKVSFYQIYTPDFSLIYAQFLNSWSNYSCPLHRKTYFSAKQNLLRVIHFSQNCCPQRITNPRKNKRSS